MTDLLNKFSDALEVLSSNKQNMREGVYCAYLDHLSDINLNELPEDVQIIFESVTDRLTSAEPPGDIGNDEASYLAKDILYMANVLSAQFDA
jgi:hypothetical protein